MKSILAIDLDNVIARTDPKLREIIGSISGISLLQEDIQSWDYADALVGKGLEVSLAKQIVAQTFDRFHEKECSDVEPVQGAIQGVLELSGAGLEILVVTGRPDTVSCRGLTKQWVQRYSIPASWLIMEENKAEASTRWSHLVDDAPHHAKEVAAAETRVLLFDYPWNRNVDDHPLIKRVCHWQEIIATILETHD